jgi:glycosyltransferase involved in cell wall biosynthesis
MPAVSIIIPAYNPGRYLRLALLSVCAQTVVDWEAIVVDDGSPEDISWVKNVDPRIRYIHQANQGQAAARNAGIANTRGQYVAFLDQDDLWLPDKIRRQVEMLELNDTMVACHTQFDLIDDAGIRKAAGYGRRQCYAEMLEGAGVCGASTVAVHRSALEKVGGFNSEDRPAEDLDLWLRLAKIGDFGFLDEVLVKYRIHEKNQSRRYRELFSAVKRIQTRHAVESPEYRRQALIGIENHRADTAAKAFDQLRTAVRMHRFGESLIHGTFVAMQRPSLLGKALIGKL